MTTAAKQRSAATMTTTSRRFPKFGSNENPSQPIGSSYGGSSWGTQTNGIWSNGVIGGSLSKRDTTGSRGSEEASPNTASGSAQLNALSEAEPWAPRAGIWNNTDSTSQGRSASGNTSPNATRDNGQSSLHDVPNGNSYFARQAISQGHNFVGRPRQGGSLDPSSSSFKYPQAVGDLTDEKENSSHFGVMAGPKFDGVPGFRSDKRGSQDPSLLGVMGVSSRDSSLPPSRHSEAHTPATSYADNFVYGSHASSHGLQSQRPSVPGHSSSFPSNSANSRGYGINSPIDEQELADRLRRSMPFGEGSEGVPNGIPSAAYAHSVSQPFQLNPGTQPWNSNVAPSRDLEQLYPQEGLAEALSNPAFAVKRGSVDRGSPAGSLYRPSLNSPKAFTPAPMPGGNAWSRPSSRDPRMSQVDRRHVDSQFHPQQPPFYPQFYNPNLPGQYPPHPYDPYNQQTNFRSPAQMQLPGYGLQFPPYLAGTGVGPSRSHKDSDPGRGVRSALLEEFRGSSKSNKRYELKDIYNHIVEFSGDQHGSRFIQQKLETANSDEKEQVFREIEPNALQLMKDVFGNYVIQKFFEHGNQVQKKVLASQMKGKVSDLSTQMYACRVVQKALEHVLVEQQAEIVDELKPEILRIVKDQNGNHVVQQIIQLVPRSHIDFIMDAFRGQVHQLAAHTYGCRVIQRLLERGEEEDKVALLKELHACAQYLVTDQYGNYVTQHVIQHGPPEDRSKMINIVTKQLVTLSKHKFASNVVEKCIEYGTPSERKAIREQLTTIGVDGTSPLQQMMKDQYGNYVIQKLMNQLDGPDRESFIEEMKPQFESLKKISTGRQIAAIDRLMSAAAALPTPIKPASGISAASASSVGPANSQGTPVLQVDVNSSAPTPSLTMEQNSPQSSSPPSTNISTVEEGALADSRRKPETVEAQAALVVQVD